MDYMTEASQNFMQKPTSYDPREREEMKRRMQAANFSFGDEKPAMQSSTGSTFLAVPVAPPSEEEQRQQRERREGARSACSQTLFAPPLLCCGPAECSPHGGLRTDLRKPHFAFGRDATEYSTSNAQRAHPAGAGRAAPVDTGDLRKEHFALGNQAAQYESTYQDQIRHAVPQPEGASIRIASEDVVLARQRARVTEEAPPAHALGMVQGGLSGQSRPPTTDQYITEYSTGVGVSASPKQVRAASEERQRWGTPLFLAAPPAPISTCR